MGELGLFMALIAFSSLLIGGDYYTYALRELLSSPRKRWQFILQHQVVAWVILYTLIIPPLSVAIRFSPIPPSILTWFFALLIIEHMSQEINRILIAMQKTVTASWVLLIKTGAWIWCVLALMYFDERTRNITSVLIGWSLGGTASILIGASSILKETKPQHLSKIDTKWLKKGFKVGLTLLMASLCTRALTTLDRAFESAFNNMDIVGVYVFYAGIAISITAIADAAIFSFLYPKMIRYYKAGRRRLFQKIKMEMITSTLIVSIGLSFAITALAPLVLHWIGRPIYTEHQDVLWILLAATTVYNLSQVPHLELYARGADKEILGIQASSLLVFVATTIGIAQYHPFLSVPISLLITYTWITGMKIIAVNKAKPEIPHQGISTP